MTRICFLCIMDFLKRLIELERYMPSWKESETIELLLAIGEPQSQENVVYMNAAREKL